MQPRLLRALLTTLVLLLGAAGAAHAKLYKWVDADGQTHYSQTKPPETKAEELKVRTAPVSDDAAKEKLEALRQKSEDVRKDREFAGTVAEQTRERQERLAKNCEIAKENLRVLKAAPRVQDTDASGSSYFLDDAQRAERIKTSQQQVDDYCN